MESDRPTVWPVMLTPFTAAGEIDFSALKELILWYGDSGIDGLFAVCQSSEMFFLSLRERLKLTAFVKRHASVPVIASGHTSFGREDQLDELKRIMDTGVDAVILLTNRIAPGEEGDRWKAGLEWLLTRLPPDTPLGLYECPYPQKHVLSRDELKFCLETGRFRFLKDTCCDIGLIRERTALLKGSGFGLYNANTSTYLDSLRCGAAGFSGVMANFHPELYVWLTKNWEAEPAAAERLQSLLTMCSFSENRPYPATAKYHLRQIGLPMELYTRSGKHAGLTDTVRSEITQMAALAEYAAARLNIIRRRIV